MFVHPKEILATGPFWVTERANMYFILQRRKGGWIAGTVINNFLINGKFFNKNIITDFAEL